MSLCKNCNTEYDISEISSSQIRRNLCKICLSKIAKEQYKNRKLKLKKDINSKICISCKKELNSDSFSKNSNSSDGKNSKCKECLSSYRKNELNEYYQRIKNNGKQKETLKKYRNKNKEKIKKNRLKYHEFEKINRKKIRQENLEKAIEILGGSCCVCGISEIAKLCIDHMNDDGSDERKTAKWEKTIKQIVTGETQYEYQILCHNHNFLKHVMIEKEIIEDNRIKKCSICNKNKSFDQFVNDRHKKSGYKSECKECSRKRHQEIKEKAINKLGGRCRKCGEENMMFLCVDHVNDDGSKKRASKEHASIYNKIVFGNITKDDLQILCLNCNAEKEYLRRRRQLTWKL